MPIISPLLHKRIGGDNWNRKQPLCQSARQLGFFRDFGRFPKLTIGSMRIEISFQNPIVHLMVSFGKYRLNAIVQSF
jgi:hypothetical protein